jgi:ribosomal protein S17
MSLEDKLEKVKHIYYDSYHGILSFNNLWNYIRDKKEIKIAKKEVKKWYSEQGINQIYKPVDKSEFKKFHAQLGLGVVQMDLMDLNSFDPKKNAGYRYLLVMIDVKSRYCWVAPIKTKTPKDILPLLKAVRALIKSIRKDTPGSDTHFTLTTDDGSEFMGVVDKYCKEQGIKRWFANPKDATKNRTYLVERMNRTILDMMKKPLELANNNSWISIIDPVIETYNENIHSTIKQKPHDVLFEDKQPYYKLDEEAEDDKFNIGDLVRILETKSIFAKKSLSTNYSKTIYEIIDKEQNRYKVVSRDTNRQSRKLFLPSQMIMAHGASVGVEKAKQTIKYKKKEQVTRKQKKSGLDTDNEGDIKIPKRLIVTNSVRPVRIKKNPKFDMYEMEEVN